jgi:hypothetical protein
MSAFATKQAALTKTIDAFIARSKTHTYPVVEVDGIPGSSESMESYTNLVAAKEAMLDAESQMKAAAQAQAVASQNEAGDAMRHFVIDYVLAYVVPPAPAASEPGSLTDAVESESDTMMFFMPGQLSGKRPKGGRLEWQVLGRRERAALNENFARELPLEYRAILKDYYERLAE